MRWKAWNHERTREFHTFARSIGQAAVNFRNFPPECDVNYRGEIVKDPEPKEKQENDQWSSR